MNADQKSLVIRLNQLGVICRESISISYAHTCAKAAEEIVRLTERVAEQERFDQWAGETVLKMAENNMRK